MSQSTAGQHRHIYFPNHFMFLFYSCSPQINKETGFDTASSIMKKVPLLSTY